MLNAIPLLLFLKFLAQCPLPAGTNYILLFSVIRKLCFILKHKIYVHPELLCSLWTNLPSLGLNKNISTSHIILVHIEIPWLKFNFSKDEDASQFLATRIQEIENSLDLAIALWKIHGDLDSFCFPFAFAEVKLGNVV